MTTTARSFGSLIAIAILLVALPLSADAARPQRVKFGRGRTTAVLKGAVRSGDDRAYMLKASSGQTMSVHATSKGKSVTFTILGPNQASVTSSTDDWSGSLPSSGDYTITVTTDNTRTRPYTLEVTIR
jgi:hypothetical protein